MILEGTQHQPRIPGTVVAGLALLLAAVGLTEAAERADRQAVPLVTETGGPYRSGAENDVPAVPPPLPAAHEPDAANYIVIEVRMITGPEDGLRQMTERLKRSSNTAEQPQTAGPASSESEPAGSDFDAHAGPGSGPAVPQVRAQRVTTIDLPVMLSVLTRAGASRLVQRAQDHERTNLMVAPKVTVASGQSAQVFSTVQRPFVVDVVGGQPQVRVLPEGVQLEVRAAFRDDDRIRLESAVALTEIGRVEVVEVHRPALAGPIKVQRPELKTTRVQTDAVIAADETIAIYGLNAPESNNKPQDMILLIQARRLGQEDQ